MNKLNQNFFQKIEISTNYNKIVRDKNEIQEIQLLPQKCTHTHKKKNNIQMMRTKISPENENPKIGNWKKKNRWKVREMKLLRAGSRVAKKNEKQLKGIKSCDSEVLVNFRKLKERHIHVLHVEKGERS